MALRLFIRTEKRLVILYFYINERLFSSFSALLRGDYSQSLRLYKYKDHKSR